MNNERFELFRFRVQFRTVTGVPGCSSLRYGKYVWLRSRSYIQ